MDIIPPPAPQVVVHQDNSAFPTGITLDETNYSLWSQLMEMRISARNKADYLTGETKKPAPGDPNRGSWITENQRVKSWLIDSMSPSLMQRFIRLPTSKDIWEAVSKTFYDGTDETCIFELNHRSFSTKQDGRPLPTYYNELVSIFQEIDHRTTTQEGTVEGVLQLHSAMARLRVHIFLSGLDSEFEQVRGEILRKDPKLDLESTYAYVRRDYQQRQTMGGSHLISENLTMLASQNRNGSSKNRGNQSSSKVNNLVCTHCGEKGHSQQRCYEIIGYPDWWDFSKKPRKKISGKANVIAAKDEEQPSPSANVTHPGIIGKASVCSVTSKNRMWIIDTGASEHMTRDSSQLKSVLPSSQSVISTANGSTSSIIGEGSITLSNTLTLDTVLVVPSLEYNLLSDILTRKILGYGVRRGKLYYLELTENEGPNISQANQASNKDRTRANIRVLQSDNGTEYMDASLGKFLNIHGIRHQTSCTYTPQQNGLAERKNRQILEVVRASLFGMNMPRFYWGEAVKSAAYIINRTPSRVLDFQTPQQKMQSLLSIPHLPNLEPRIFGCIVYSHIPKSLRTKLDLCAKRCVFIGYSDLQKGGVSYHSLQGESLCEENGQRENEGGDEFVELEDMVEKLQNGDGNEVQQGCDNMTETECDPSNFLDMSEAQSRPLELPMSTPLTEELTESVPPQDALEDPKWTKAMNEEMEALQKNATWELVSLPKGRKTIGCRWVFTIKLRADGSIDRYKARLVAKGYTQRNEVCKLKKSLYGLKQSPRAWFGRFSATMKAAGYKQRDDLSKMKALQEHLAAEFEMKDLGQLKYFLGIEVARSKSGIFLSQRKYVLDLLTETGMLDCKPAETPMEMNHKLGILPNQTPTDKGRYQRLVGRLIYLSHTRTDIAYAVSIVSQFMHSPSEEHMDAVYRILRYLKCAPGKGLLFSKNNVSNIEGYTDSDWAGDQTTRRSTSGYFTFVEGNLVTWRSKKQKVVARSSAEAEFRGMAQGVCEMLWIKNILKDLGIDYAKPMNLKCDSKAAIEIAQNPVQHDRTKHVEVDRHFIKEKLDEKTIQFPFVQSGDQLADILTKVVSGRVFHDIIDKLGMIDIYAPT
ncbi:hypothetical protein KPL70_008430 [Citrus sinensis]|nr:hypothetical protein KPL70_008430 [Citrus sinensis]